MLWASVGEGIAWEGNDWTASNFSMSWLGPMDPDYLNGKLMRMDWQGKLFGADPHALLVIDSDVFTLRKRPRRQPLVQRQAAVVAIEGLGSRPQESFQVHSCSQQQQLRRLVRRSWLV
jgi:hypothetical protein